MTQRRRRRRARRGRFGRRAFLAGAGCAALAGAAVLFLTALLRLDRFTRNLPYRILGQQPVVAEEKAGAFTRLGLFLERHSLQKKEEA